MSAVVLPFFENRPVVRCECGLVQFMTAQGICRKCYLEYEDPDEMIPVEPEPEPEDVKMLPKFDVGGTIRVLRKMYGLTQKEAAKRMGFVRPYLCKIENHQVAPLPTNVPKFAKAFGMSGAEFVTFMELMAVTDSIQ